MRKLLKTERMQLWSRQNKTNIFHVEYQKET